MVVMRTEKSKQALVDFCRHINGIRPTNQMSIIEIGSFAGHDYWRKFPGVIQAVNEIVGKPERVF